MASTTTTAVAKQANFTIDPDQALKASKALLAHIKKTAKENAASSNKKNILDAAADDDEATTVAETPVWLTVTTKRHIHDSKALKPNKISLPHPLNTDNESTICIIVSEPQRHYKNVVASEDFPAELRGRITRVIDFKHLIAKFKQYEAQRKLFAEHDIFLADDRIINRLPKAISVFYKTTAKRPIPVVFQSKKVKVDGAKPKKTKRSPDEPNCRPVAEVAAEIQKAIGAALVNLSPSNNTAVKVGYASMDGKALSENIVKVANDMANKYVPKKKNGIKSIFVKGPETVALPIWQDTELWVDAETDVIEKGSEQAKAIEARKEQANVGKKRKSIDASEEEPKSKKAKKAAAVDSNDDNLDKQIAERKTKLRKAKKVAQSAMEE
ncbi:hypothetical protein VPNG_06072 [Cytospora leucostoma]|uniref:Ribosomal protein L1 n=1 Tax=Cytospora leucostoma TaxID=1230097 RepID=A0A423WX50_9PEZI|nr:hypothetical protein VPNG_06072 [Cytospora leucostoma]